MSMSVQKSQVHKMAKLQDGVKRLCLVDDLKMLKITMSNTSSRNKLNPEVNDHYNIFTRESQEYELKTKDEAILKKLLDRVLQLHYPFSLQEHLKADDTELYSNILCDVIQRSLKPS
ncbi:hypothetical protein Tco_1185403 [Tanacetum coccineum]